MKMKLKAEEGTETKLQLEVEKWKNAFTSTVIPSSKHKSLKLLNDRIT